MAREKTDSEKARDGAEPEPTAAQRMLLDEAGDDRLLGWAFVPAVLVHLLLLVVQLPSAPLEPARASQQRKVYVVEPLRFEPPPPRANEPFPKPIARRQPMPDPTSDDPGPVRIEEPQDVDVPVDPLVLELPEAPPTIVATGPISVTGEVIVPEKIYAPPPRYPELARKARIQGTVILQATISARGEVEEVAVLRGQPMGLTEEAIETVRRWRFAPARLNGKPVAVYFNLVVHFELK